MADAISVSAPISGTDRTMSFEAGKLAQLADGAVVARIGDTVLLATATAARHVREGTDFFPLTVDIEERTYAAGKIPGSFFRREGKSSDQAILTCRLIDRPLRPSFPEGFRNEVHVVGTIIGADQVNPHDVLAINASSAALMLSGIPFDGPIGAVRVAYTTEGTWIPHPTFEEGEESTFELVVAGRALTEDADTDIAIMMVEAGGTEKSWSYYDEGAPKVTEEVLASGLEAAKTWIREAINLQRRLVQYYTAARGPIVTIPFSTFSYYQDDVFSLFFFYAGLPSIAMPTQPPAGQGTAVTIGAYDGVHLGHRALLRDLSARAEAAGLSTVVVTFDRHPAAVVRPESAPKQLTGLEQKLELLADCGIDRTVVVPFDLARAEESAEDFVKEVLVDQLAARLVVVGEDFHFGHGRRGNVELLRRLGADYGFEVVGVGLTGDGRDAVSSTRIRALLTEGDVEGAARLLGRPHEVRGHVVHGDGRGGPELGFPTANLAVADDIALPADAVYAGHYRRPDGSLHQAAISVGRRPTFYEPGTAPVLVEAYLLHFEGDLYGEAAAVSFAHRLREEQRFDSVEALIAQMQADVEATERVLATADRP